MVDCVLFHLSGLEYTLLFGGWGGSWAFERKDTSFVSFSFVSSARHKRLGAWWFREWFWRGFEILGLNDERIGVSDGCSTIINVQSSHQIVPIDDVSNHGLGMRPIGMPGPHSNTTATGSSHAVGLYNLVSIQGTLQ